MYTNRCLFITSRRLNLSIIYSTWLLYWQLGASLDLSTVTMKMKMDVMWTVMDLTWMWEHPLPTLLFQIFTLSVVEGFVTRDSVSNPDTQPVSGISLRHVLSTRIFVLVSLLATESSSYTSSELVSKSGFWSLNELLRFPVSLSRFVNQSYC